MHRFKNMKIWQESMSLSIEVYKAISNFPNDERYGLTSQIKRAAVSIPSNIAEGSSRTSNKDFGRYLSISLGSAFELETQLYIAKELSLLNDSDYTRITTKLEQIQKMIIGFQNSLSNSILNDSENEFFNSYLSSKI